MGGTEEGVKPTPRLNLSLQLLPPNGPDSNNLKRLGDARRPLHSKNFDFSVFQVIYVENVENLIAVTEESLGSLP